MLSKCPKKFSKFADVLSRHISTTVIHHNGHHVYGCRENAGDGSHTQGEDAHLYATRRCEQANLCRYIEAYRTHGHKRAKIDPLGITNIPSVNELDPSLYGLGQNQNSNCITRAISKHNNMLDLTGLIYTRETELTLEQLTDVLEREYCGTISAEFMHLPDEQQREWFAQKFEAKGNIEISNDRRMDVAKLLLQAETLDKFLTVKFSTLKRYSGEGNETMLAFLDELMRQSVTCGVSNIVMCMAHRGRLNLLTCLLNYPPVSLFTKIKGLSEFPPGTQATGDVLSHAFTSCDVEYDHRSVHVSFLPNPSHLEIANPVAAGKSRSIQQTLQTGPYNRSSRDNSVLCVQIHGDAAVSGQGVIAETLAFSECPHFTINGTVHLVTNNQIGFTTGVTEGRSSMYCSDFAKLTGCPVIHVNADDAEGLLRAANIAIDYRTTFQRDIVVDMMCYRRWGHNELDEPSFTQPAMYHAVRSRSSIPTVYSEQLQNSGVCSSEDIQQYELEWRARLDQDFSLIDSHTPSLNAFQSQWSGYIQSPPHISVWDTGVPTDLLKFIGAKSVEIPDDLTVHATLQKAHIDKRLQRISDGSGLDWATAESLAIGSLLLQGMNARISGQDVGRGTFSHRHAMLVDQKTDRRYIPLNNMVPQQSNHFELANSILSEEAVLAFEYGFSIDNPRNLVLWEAQFGDFFNGAQIVVDTFIASGETKWLLQSGLVLLLPHGYDGAGPEHTSCKIERFLQLTDSSETKVDGDNVNFSVVNPTTPAQYFHLLRRQMVRNFRKPLIVVAPKVLLKHQRAVSSLTDMSPGTSFSSVLADSSVTPDQVKKLVFCSGKHFYTLDEERRSRGRSDIAFVRLECLCPFPAEEIRKQVETYKNVQEYVWCQEEQRNMGAWTFIRPRFNNILGIQLEYIGRDELATPAVGIGQLHQAEAQHILDTLFR